MQESSQLLQLRAIIKDVRVSPQHREDWFDLLQNALRRAQDSQASQSSSDAGFETPQSAERDKILLLDVRT
jgi:hypothetical protein